MAVHRTPTPATTPLPSFSRLRYAALRHLLVLVVVTAVAILAIAHDVLAKRSSANPQSVVSVKLTTTAPRLSTRLHRPQDESHGSADATLRLPPSPTTHTQRSQVLGTVTTTTPSTTAPTTPSTTAPITMAQFPTLKRSLEGPLCVFVPANGHDEKHMLEIDAVLDAWGDGSTLLFTENSAVINRTEAVAARKRIARALVEMSQWRDWHEATVLAVAGLRRRGSTKENLRGRGQLSIPLFYWISQLVKKNDPLVQNCKWFMKCDTDTYLRRKLFEQRQLAKLNHSEPIHLGVPLMFNTRPYHSTFRYIHFSYNIGGPGYSFSRELMQRVRMEECIDSMAKDPILLIHDDVATGYCATYHAEGVIRISSNATVTSSFSGLVANVSTSGIIADALNCVDCVCALHPVTPILASQLAARDASFNVDRALCDATERCTLKFMHGTPL